MSDFEYICRHFKSMLGFLAIACMLSCEDFFEDVIFLRYGVRSVLNLHQELVVLHCSCIL